MAALALAGLSLYQAPPFEVQGLTLALIACAVTATVLAPQTPIGNFPSGAVFYLLLVAQVSPAVGAVSFLVGFLLWAVAYSKRSWESELRLNGLPVLLTAAVTNLALRGQPKIMLLLGVGLVFLLTLNLCASWQARQAHKNVAWEELRWAFLRSSMVIPLLFAMGYELLPKHPGWLVPLTVVSWFQASGAVTELVRSQIKPMNTELKSTREREKRWVDRLKVLERLSKRVTAASSVEEAVTGIQTTAQEYCPDTRVRIQLGQPPDGDDSFALADAGRLQVTGEISSEQAGLLSALSTTAGFALKMVQARQQQLDSVKKERDQMEEWLAHLRELLRATQSMASALSLESVLKTAETTLQELVPHQKRALVCFKPPRTRANAPLETCQAILNELKSSGESRFEADLLVVPVIFEGVTRGGLVLTGEKFSRIQFELLRILAYQLGGSFERARLYEQILEAEQQVIQASKMAAVGQLAAGIAHELNTPLGTVMMALEYAESRLDKQPDKARERLKLAHRSGAKARGIIAKLLHYSTDATLEGQPVDLVEVVNDVAENAKYHLDKAGLKLKTEVPSEPCIVVGNQNEIHQVLNNLVQNAQDSLAKSDHQTIKVRLVVQESKALLSVADDGPGVEPEVAERLFEPFFSTRERQTGLGLSVAKQLVEKHGGSIDWDSASGQTIFTVSLHLK
jgi:signal transduction histidine kinase